VIWAGVTGPGNPLADKRLSDERRRLAVLSETPLSDHCSLPLRLSTNELGYCGPSDASALIDSRRGRWRE